MTGDRLLQVIRAIAREMFPRYDFLGRYRYRVIAMQGERAVLQAVRKEPGLPDLPPIPIVAGMAGLFAELTPSAIVLVEFIEGDPNLPIITGFSRDGGETFVPVSLTLDAVNALLFGRDATRGVARLDDSVTTLLPPATFTGTIGGSPAVGMVVWSPGQTMGNITTASAKVRSE
ncbi:hypothetical protein WMF20_35365 [Sorangium sp. So ce834]|uniref:hypothetical protein n=1 Tax=Sorangium sp. So ce834 TaxID=3133321 RepID=UPI003F6172C7